MILDGDEYLDLEIHENELAGINDKDLKKWGISRETPHRCFAESVELMKYKTERDRMRPIAEHVGDGPDAWEVLIVGYSTSCSTNWQRMLRSTARYRVRTVRFWSIGWSKVMATTSY